MINLVPQKMQFSTGFGVQLQDLGAVASKGQRRGVESREVLPPSLASQRHH